MKTFSFEITQEKIIVGLAWGLFVAGTIVGFMGKQTDDINLTSVASFFLLVAILYRVRQPRINVTSIVFPGEQPVEKQGNVEPDAGE